MPRESIYKSFVGKYVEVIYNEGVPTAGKLIKATPRKLYSQTKIFIQ